MRRMVNGGWVMVDGRKDSGKIERVEDMPVYQAFYGLALEVEKTTRNYGPDFRWLRNQTLRASESVCANMTEGFYAQYSTEYVHDLYRCRREARQTVMHLNYAKDTRLLDEVVVGLLERYEDAMHQLTNLIASIERKIQCRGKSKPEIPSDREDKEEYGLDSCISVSFH